MRTQSEMLSDKPDDPEGGVRGPPDEGEGDVVVEAGNLNISSHMWWTEIACSLWHGERGGEVHWPRWQLVLMPAE